MLEREGRLPDEVAACVGGGSNAIGLFSGFLNDPEVAVTGVEPAGKGLQFGLGAHAATLSAGVPGKVHGFNKETVEPKMECKMFHTRDDDLLAIGKIEDATVIFECDTGDTYVLREAFVLEPAKLEAKDGTVSVSFSAISCERM